MHTLAIIVPYRDREEQLNIFTDRVKTYLNNRGIRHHILVVEQCDDKPFNRGKLLNIGFKYAVRKRCDYVVFHDVDKIPISIDYSYADYPIHLATNDIPFKEYFGGVTLFPVQDFQKING